MSDYEQVTLTTTNQTARYDGILQWTGSAYSSSRKIYVNDVLIFDVTTDGGSTGNPSAIFLKKGDTYRAIDGNGTISNLQARWYKDRDYTGR